MTRRLLYCGLVAGPVFVLTFLIEGALKGDGYEVLRHPVSSLALGDWGWIQSANFLVGAMLTILFTVGLWRSRAVARAGAVLIGIWGLALVGAGLFRTDPVSGFPLGTPATSEYTTSGALHDGFSLPGFLALAAAQVVLARGQGRRWLVYSLLSATAFLVMFLLASAGFSQTEPLIGIAGLLQRLAVIIGWTWLVALAVRVRQPVVVAA
jgi:hypothetical membrane protein